MKKFTLLFLVLLLNQTLPAQYWKNIDTVFNPFGVAVLNWSSPEFCDLDGDGDYDLILGNGSSEELRFFRNVGTKSAPLFRRDTTVFASVYASGYMGTNSDYPILCDLNGDRKYDLVIGGYNGILLYYNIGDSLTPLWKKDTIVFVNVDSVIGTDAKPALADLDGDGDLDLLVGIGESLFGGPTAGITMGFRNTGTKVQPVFTPDNSLVSGIADVGLNAYPVLRDLDDDGKIDLVLGRDLTGFYYYRNTGTAQSPAWTLTSSVFSGIGGSTYWNNPTFCDLDGDGDLDFIYGSSDGTIFYYQNVGSKSTPLFQYNSNYFRVIRIDGNASTVSLADFDKDGDVDLLSGDWLGTIQLFRNDGTPTQPRFVKATAAFTSIDVGSYSSPVWVDIDNDGDYDIVSGALDGKIYCYINNNGTFTPNTTIFGSIDVGWRSLPAFADLDGDGALDLLVGAEDAASMLFLKNNGQNVFTPDPSFITGVTGVRDGHPAFADIDGDGDYDLFLGTGSGNINFYENTGTRTMPQWERKDFIFSDVSVHQDASPAFADLDGDKKLDIVIGEYNGNFTFFKNLIPTSVRTRAQQIPSVYSLLQNYPNPFNGITNYEFSITNEQRVSIKVFDLLGREVATVVDAKMNAGKHTVQWNTGELPSGVYFYKMEAGNFVGTKKLCLIR